MKALLLSLLSLLPLGMWAGEAVSPRLTGGQEAVPITLDLRGSRTLALTVEVGGDTYDHDQAIWGDAAILLEDGSRVPLASLTPEETQVGWGTLLREGRNHLGKPLTVGGKTFASGLWSHAPAFLLYALPEGAVRFEAKVGIDADQMNIQVTHGRSEIYDALTHLTFLYNEADKIMRHARLPEGGTSREWRKIEQFVCQPADLDENTREVYLSYLSILLPAALEDAYHG